MLVAVTRIMLGFVFVWAFIDKTFGFGMGTEPAKAWIAGGSPTSGFLQYGVNEFSPLRDFFVGLAGQAWVDWLFMLGLLGVGLALMLGIGLRIAAVAGTALMLLMWAALVPLENNPFIDDHVIYAVLLWVFVFAEPDLSVNKWWMKQPYVKKNSWLW